MTLEELKKIFEYCTGVDAPDMYRTLYAEHNAPTKIESWNNWHALPALERIYRSNIPFAERCFTPLANVPSLRATSGTSGNPPLFSPLTRGCHDFLLSHWKFNAPLLCAPIQHPSIELTLKTAGISAEILLTDMHNLEATGKLAANAGVRGLVMAGQQARPLSETLVRHGLADTIEFIATGGSSSGALFTYLHRTFPNAKILFFYGSSDVEGAPMGIPCRALSSAEDVPHYHPNVNIHLDLVDDRGEPLEPDVGVEGDLLVTSWVGDHAASPLIRYKNGDRIRIVDGGCEIPELAFTVLGRSESDFAKLSGAMLSVVEIERVLKNMGRNVEFQMRYTEVETTEGFKVRATLFLDLPAQTDWEALAQEIASKLYVGPTATYEKLTSRDYFYPLVCKPLERPKPPLKLKRLLRE